MIYTQNISRKVHISTPQFRTKCNPNNFDIFSESMNKFYKRMIYAVIIGDAIDHFYRLLF